jgi:tRNA nucleotidyltransferase (CCA-adding enzyme)
MNQYVVKICQAVAAAGGRAMLVGGCVRDRLLGLEAKDIDLEVYHLEPSRLRQILQTVAPVNTVGEHFAVYKLAFYAPDPAAHTTGEQGNLRFEIDVSIPRRESKSGKGHRGFVIQGDPRMSFMEAARRRDFTINAILRDPLTDEIVDPYGGVADLNRQILRAVAADTFIEDSLRVLRGVQLAARFALKVAPETIELCRSIELTDLPQERIWGEIEKLFLLAGQPSIGLQIALEMEVLKKLFPQIHALTDDRLSAVTANQVLPRENSFERTKMRLDQAAALTLPLPKEKRLSVMLAAFCLNLVVPPAGESESVVALLDTLGVHTIAGYDVREQVLALLREQARVREFYFAREQVTPGDFRRLAQRVDMNLLHLLGLADHLAGDPCADEAARWFREQTLSLRLENGPPAAILMGRHLLEAGMQPGRQVGETLRRVYELQLDGAVTNLDQALAAAGFGK